ncbi:hypothetical protein IGB42_01871 [Andreprevotia sp. IGB-42]|uniref:hypothetical protein n=1 Tax=Andreprevotia sp. IGB-42 TaxID=2497473 RepID=UPI00135B7003|nr:hypothetical protein [Andreprevotia sp. IGB-42]KAF0813520.1 hypothetical protein IGB42_01871 [Andreprevotia sp. IGB-42]
MNAETSTLFELLDGMGMYNDKGVCRANHTADEIAATRAGFHSALSKLLAEIGPANLPPVAVQLLQNDAWLSDGNGELAARMKALIPHG